MAQERKNSGNPLDLLGGPSPRPQKNVPPDRPRAAKQERPRPARPEVVPQAPEHTQSNDSAPVASAAPQESVPVQTVSDPLPNLPEYDLSPVHLKALIAHHLRYYGFPANDQELIDEALTLMNHDIRCQDPNNWLVFNPTGRDFLLVTSDKELSRAAHTKGSAVRIGLLRQLQEDPFPLGQLLMFREEFADFLRPCSHLIALQVMSKALVQGLVNSPVSREYVLKVKQGVHAVYKRRHRPLTLHKLQAVSLAVIAGAHARGLTWEELKGQLERMVVSQAEGDF